MKETIVTSTTLKNSSYIPAFILGLSFEALSILGVLMVIDTILGITRSVVIHGPRSFTSRMLTHGVLSKLLVLLVPILVVWTGKGAGIDLTMVASGIISVLVLAEAYSILGHIQAIRIREDIKEYDAISLILTNLRTLLDKMLRATPEKGTRGEK